MSTVKSLGNYSIRLEGTSLTLYKRGGSKLARKYYASEDSAKRAYKNLTSIKKLMSWAKRAVASNPRSKKNPVTSKQFQGLGPLQKHMLRFIKKTSAGKRAFHIADDSDTKRVAETLKKRGIISIDKAYTNWVIRLTPIGRAWLKRTSI